MRKSEYYAVCCSRLRNSNGVVLMQLTVQLCACKVHVAFAFEDSTQPPAPSPQLGQRSERTMGAILVLGAAGATD